MFSPSAPSYSLVRANPAHLRLCLLGHLLVGIGAVLGRHVILGFLFVLFCLFFLLHLASLHSVFRLVAVLSLLGIVLFIVAVLPVISWPPAEAGKHHARRRVQVKVLGHVAEVAVVI